MANRNFANSRIYTGHVKPVMIDMTFTVSANDAGGLGIVGLKGPYVQNVFMNTSQTPGKGNSNPATPNIVVKNPNPAAGTIVIQLQDNYAKLYDMDASIQSPTSGSAVKIDNSALTPGVAYIITTVGNASLATWQGVGLPIGITPAVGVAFIASSAGGSGNTLTSRVMTTAAAGSGIFAIEQVGNGNLALAPAPSSNQGFGAQIILQCRNDSSSDASQIATPADQSVITIRLLLGDSSVVIQGE